VYLPNKHKTYITCMIMILSFVTACGGTTTAPPYGGAQNHMHDMLGLQHVSHTLLVATHIGLYRTTDFGQHFTTVAGDAGQSMDGLMLFKLAQSPVDAQRVYILAIPRTDNQAAARAVPGVYTSDNAGVTWTLATPASELPTKTIFTIGAGSASAGQVFTIIPALAEKGLYGTDDFGAHWHALPTLPDAHPTGVMGDPHDAKRLFLWSGTSGFFISDDGGQTWKASIGVEGGINVVTATAGIVYALGDNGVYVSHDDGASFTLTFSDHPFSAIAVSPTQPTIAYARTGTGVFVTKDGGQTWQPTAPTSRRPDNLAIDETDPNTVYVSFSYPLGVEKTTDGGAHWNAIVP